MNFWNLITVRSSTEAVFFVEDGFCAASREAVFFIESGDSCGLRLRVWFSNKEAKRVEAQEVKI